MANRDFDCGQWSREGFIVIAIVILFFIFIFVEGESSSHF